MNNFDDNFIAEILKRLKMKLGRELTAKEFSVGACFILLLCTVFLFLINSQIHQAAIDNQAAN